MSFRSSPPSPSLKAGSSANFGALFMAVVSPNLAEPESTGETEAVSALEAPPRAAADQDLHNGFLAVFDQGLVSGLSFATSALIANFCGRAELGVAHLALTLVFLLANIQGELVSAPYTVYRGRKRGANLHAYSGSMLAHQFLLSIVGLLAIGGLLIGTRLGFGPTGMATALGTLLLISPLCLLQVFLRHFAFAAFQFRLAATMDVCAVVVQLTALALLAAAGHLTVVTAFAAMGLAAAVACACWFIVQPEPLRFVASRLWPHWRENWQFGRWALSSHLIGCAGTYVLPWLLAVVHDESATGLLAGCGKLSALAATFVLGVAHFLTSKAVAAFAEGGPRKLQRVLLAIGTVFVLGVGLFCGIVWVSGDWLLVTLFGADFTGAMPVALILSLSVLLNSIAIIGGNGLWAVRRPQANLISDVAALVATLTVAGLLVENLGALGIAWASLAGGAVGAVVRTATLLVILKGMPEETEPAPC